MLEGGLWESLHEVVGDCVSGWAIYGHKLLVPLGLAFKSHMMIYCDSQSAITMARKMRI